MYVFKWLLNISQTCTHVDVFSFGLKFSWLDICIKVTSARPGKSSSFGQDSDALTRVCETYSGVLNGILAFPCKGKATHWPPPLPGAICGKRGCGWLAGQVSRAFHFGVPYGSLSEVRCSLATGPLITPDINLRTSHRSSTDTHSLLDFFLFLVSFSSFYFLLSSFSFSIFLSCFCHLSFSFLFSCFYLFLDRFFIFVQFFKILFFSLMFNFHSFFLVHFFLPSFFNVGQGSPNSCPRTPYALVSIIGASENAEV